MRPILYVVVLMTMLVAMRGREATAAGWFDDVGRSIGKAVEKAAQDTGRSMEKAAQDTGRIVGGTVQDAVKNIEKPVAPLPGAIKETKRENLQITKAVYRDIIGNKSIDDLILLRG